MSPKKYDAGNGYIYARCVGLVFGDGDEWKGWGNLHSTRGCPANAEWIVMTRLLDGAGPLGKRQRVFKRTDRVDNPFLIFEERPPYELHNLLAGHYGEKIDPALIYTPGDDFGE